MSLHIPPYHDYVWQFTDPDPEGWSFGRMVRGIVRDVAGEIYFTEGNDTDQQSYGWVWITHIPHLGAPHYLLDSPRGKATSRKAAIEAVEKALGVI